MKYKPLSLITTALLFFCMFTGYTQSFWDTLYFPDSTNILSLTVNNQGYIFAGTGKNAGTGGIYRSTDTGISWDFLGMGDKGFYSLTINELGYIYAGSNGDHSIYRSIDNGQSWEGLNVGIENVICLKSFPGGLMFASSGTGSYVSIIRSFDYGNTWQEVLTFPSNVEFPNDIAIQNSDTIYAGTTNFLEGGGMFRSVDGGSNWDTIGLYNFHVRALALNSKGDLFVGTYGHNTQYWLSGLYVKYHNQNNWVKKTSGYITKIIINKYDDISAALGEGIEGRVIASKDNGESFQLLDGSFPNDIESMVIDSAGYLYAASYNPCMLAKSRESTTIITLDGSVTYANAGDTPLAGITVELAKGDSIVMDTLTNAQGYYLFRDIDTGTYTMNVISHKPWGGVSAADVLLYRKHIANISSLNGIYLASGDVNGSGDLTAVDVLLIKKRIAHLIDAFPAGDWLFNNQPVTVNGRVTYNFKGICYGDANGSYVPMAK